MERYTSAIRSRLAHLNGLGQQTAAVERQISGSAHARLAVVEGELNKLRPRVNLDDSAAERYQALTLEKGRLLGVL